MDVIESAARFGTENIVARNVIEGDNLSAILAQRTYRRRLYSKTGPFQVHPFHPFTLLPITKSACRASTQLFAPGSSQLGAFAMSDT